MKVKILVTNIANIKFKSLILESHKNVLQIKYFNELSPV